MKTMFRYGLLSGVLICILMFGPHFLFGMRAEWLQVSEVVGYTSMVLCMTATYFAMRAEHARRGPLGYGQALAVGVAVSTVAGVLFGLATWAFCAYAGDALPETLMEHYRQQIVSAGGADQAARLAELEAMRPLLYNHPLQGAVMAATVFLIGVAVSLPSAWWVRRGTAGA